MLAELANPERTYSIQSYINAAYGCAKIGVQCEPLLQYLETMLNGEEVRGCDLKSACLLAWSVVQLATLSTAPVKPEPVWAALTLAIPTLEAEVKRKAIHPTTLTMLGGAVVEAPAPAAARGHPAAGCTVHRRPWLAPANSLQLQRVAAQLHPRAHGHCAGATGRVQGLQAAPHNPLWLSTIRTVLGEGVSRRAAVDHLLTTAAAQAPAMQHKSLQLVAWSCCMLQCNAPAVVAALEARALQLAPTMDAWCLASVCWSFAVLHHDSPELTEAISAAAVTLLRDPKAAGTVGGQAVSMLAYSLAVVDRCAGPHASVLMPLLAARGEAVMDDAWPQGLCNLAWGFAVAGMYPDTFFRRWRAVIAAVAPSISSNGLAQLHQIEVAMRLEAPHIGKLMQPC